MTVANQREIARGGNEVTGEWILYHTGGLQFFHSGKHIASGTHMGEETVSADLRYKLAEAVFSLYTSAQVNLVSNNVGTLDKLVFDFHPQFLSLMEAILYEEHFTAAEKALVLYSALKLRPQVEPQTLVEYAKDQHRLTELQPSILPWGEHMSSWLTPEISSLLKDDRRRMKLVIINEFTIPRFRVEGEYERFLKIYEFLENSEAGETLDSFCARSGTRFVSSSLPRVYLKNIRLLAKTNAFGRLGGLTKDELISIIPSYDSASEFAIDFLVERAKRGEVCALVTRGYDAPLKFNKASKILTESQCRRLSDHESRFGKEYWENLGISRAEIQIAILALVATRGEEATEEIIANITKTSDRWGYLALNDRLKSPKDVKKFLSMALEENLEIPPVWATIVAGLES